jgi:hypothetical protein
VKSLLAISVGKTALNHEAVICATKCHKDQPSSMTSMREQAARTPENFRHVDLQKRYRPLDRLL